MQHQFTLGAVALFVLLHSSPALTITPGDGWQDSYSVDGQCYCHTTFDHDAGTIEVDTPQGIKTVREICETIGSGPGIGSNPVYNDVQCGNGPPNSSYDEVVCPGRVDMGEAGCEIIGPTWNLEQYFPAPNSTGTASGSSTGESTGTTTGDTSSNGSTGALPADSLLFEAENLVSADSRWILTDSSTPHDTSNDPDANHSDGASNARYLELLPDTYVTNSDTANNTNQWNDPGFGPVLQYDIDVPAAGVYAIAVRGYATGDHDRRIHAGVDGLWNTSAANIALCEIDQWSWSNSCEGASHTIEFDSAGIHQLMFSAADDGFEFDQFTLAAVSDETTATTPQLANAVSVGEGVAFGAAVAPWLSAALGILLALRLHFARRRTLKF